jgi:hypothetical protein
LLQPSLRVVFSKTLFTPAGIDVYIRSTEGSNPDSATRQTLVDRIVQVVKENEDGGVKSLAQGGFDIPGVI